MSETLLHALACPKCGGGLVRDPVEPSDFICPFCGARFATRGTGEASAPAEPRAASGSAPRSGEDGAPEADTGDPELTRRFTSRQVLGLVGAVALLATAVYGTYWLVLLISDLLSMEASEWSEVPVLALGVMCAFVVTSPSFYIACVLVSVSLLRSIRGSDKDYAQRVRAAGSGDDTIREGDRVDAIRRQLSASDDLAVEEEKRIKEAREARGGRGTRAKLMGDLGLIWFGGFGALYVFVGVILLGKHPLGGAVAVVSGTAGVFIACRIWHRRFGRLRMLRREIADLRRAEAELIRASKR